MIKTYLDHVFLNRTTNKYNKNFIIHIILVITLLMILFSSCRGNDSQFKFAYDLSSNPTNMDPQIANDSEEKIVLANTMEGLLTFDEQGQIVGGVAESYTVSEDGLVYTFYLREDANWVTYKGEIYSKVTANDFKYTFTRLFDPTIGSVHAYNFSAIKNAGAILSKQLGVDQLGVDVVDDYTLRISLEYEYPMFPELLTTTHAMPCNQQFFMETKGTYGLGREHLIYNGPFYMSTWNSGSNIAIRKNSYYNSTTPTIASSVTFFIPNTDNNKSNSEDDKTQVKKKTPLEKFESGTTDAIILSADAVSEVDITKYNSQVYEDTSWMFMVNTDNDVLQNRNIRLALMHSIKNDLYIDALPKTMTKAQALVPHIISGVDDESFRQSFGEDMTIEYNPQVAKKYLSQGLADLGVFSFPKITIIYPENEYFTELLQGIQRQWQSELSIFINISPLPSDEVKANIAKGDYDIAITSLRSTSNSPASILSMFTDESSTNYSSYSSPTYNRLLLQAATNTDLYESYSLYNEAEKTIIGDGVIYPIAYQTSNYLVGKNVKGIFFSPFGDIVYFKYGIIV